MVGPCAASRCHGGKLYSCLVIIPGALFISHYREFPDLDFAQAHADLLHDCCQYAGQCAR